MKTSRYGHHGQLLASFAGLSVARRCQHSGAHLLFAIAGVLLAGGCAKRETAIAAGLRTQTLHLNGTQELRDLDPQTAAIQPEIDVLHALMEGLTDVDPKDSRPVPGVAERWEHSADGLVWTFHLRADARWSNGDPVTAHDFVFAYQRVLSPALGAEYREQFFCLAQAEEFTTKKISDFAQVGVRAENDHTLVLTLKHPVPHLPSLMTQPWWGPLHRATIEKFGRIDQRATSWTRPGNFIGNGPFVLKEWAQSKALRATKSPTYWDHERVRLNEVIFYPIDNLAVAEAAFRAGQLHVTKVDVTKAAAYRKDPRNAPLLHESTTLATAFYRLNCARPPLDDARVRRALSLAIDREQLARSVLQSDQAAFSLTPPNCGGYTADRSVRTDVAEARRLLASAGFPDGTGFPSLELLYFEYLGADRAMAEAIQQMWRTHLGINVTLAQQEMRVSRENRRTGNYQIGGGGWIGDYLDPTSFLDLLRSTDGNNTTRWASAEYDALLLKAMGTLDPPARHEWLRRAEALMLAEAPIIPLYYIPRRELRHPTVKGWDSNLLDLHPLKFVYLDN